jgi:hypothetical membrane protein
LFGISGSVSLIINVLAATMISPWFRWDTNALSELGVGEVSTLFNSAVLIGGVLIFFFALGIQSILNEERIVKVGIASVMSGSTCLALVGIFTIDYSWLHGIVSLGHFILPPIGYLLIGFGTKDSEIKKMSIVTGIAALTAILVLPLITLILQFKVGFSVPEILHALIIGVWTLNMAKRLIKY